MKKKLLAKYDLIDCKDDYDCDVHWENFKGNLDYYFNKYIGHKVIVKGKNMTWKNLSGLKKIVSDSALPRAILDFKNLINHHIIFSKV